MATLLDYKRENENKNYFRVVRDNLSLSKRTATYLGIGTIAGGIGALTMLIPAIGPIIAAPTYFTVLSVSSNLVGAAVFGGVPLVAQHYAILRKDNKLYQAERAIQSAGKLQVKLHDKGDKISDRKFAKLSAKRDKKLQRFEKVYNTYQRKTEKLAKKANVKYDVVKDETIDLNTKTTLIGKMTDTGSFINNRRRKKFLKAARIYRDLHEDKVDFYRIKNGKDMEAFKENLNARKVSHRVASGATAVGHKAKSGATAVGSASKNGILKAGAKINSRLHGVGKSKSAKSTTKKSNVVKMGFGKIATSTKSGARKISAYFKDKYNNAKMQRQARKDAVTYPEGMSENRKRAIERARFKQTDVETTKTPSRTQLLLQAFKEKYGVSKEIVKSGFNKFYGASKGVAEKFKNRYLTRFRPVERASIQHMEMPGYTRTEIDRLSLFEQYKLLKQTYLSGNDNLIRINERTRTFDIVQPRELDSTEFSKEKYLNSLQNVNTDIAPMPVLNNITFDDYLNYYSSSEYDEKASKLYIAYKDFEKKFRYVEKLIDSNSIDTQVDDSEIFVQLDIEKPNLTLYKKFDDPQKALAFTRFVQKYGTDNLLKENCEQFRVTTWQKEETGAYKPIVLLSNLVEDKIDLKENNEQMRNSFFREMRTLQKNAYVLNEETSKFSTVEMIKQIENWSGNGQYSEEQIKQILETMVDVDINALIGEEKLEDSKLFSQREKDFYTYQFSRKETPENTVTF